MLFLIIEKVKLGDILVFDVGMFIVFKFILFDKMLIIKVK